jgi:hypothetical protein
MPDRLHTRLEELRSELATGQVELDKVERQRTYLRETMLRISGGIQVLEELVLASNNDGDSHGPEPSPDRASRTQSDVSVTPSTR